MCGTKRVRGDRTVTLCNVHLETGGENNADQVTQVLPARKAGSDIVGGDFNARRPTLADVPPKYAQAGALNRLDRVFFKSAAVAHISTEEISGEGISNHTGLFVTLQIL